MKARLGYHIRSLKFPVNFRDELIDCRVEVYVMIIEKVDLKDLCNLSLVSK